MTGARRAIPATLAMVLVAGLAGCSGDSPAATTRLRVEVSGLPPGVAGRIEVQGPERYTVTGTDEREVPAGRYTIEIGAVRTAASTALPADRTVTVDVAANATETAAAAYRITIPDSTTVLDPVRPGITAVAGATVRFTRNAPQVASLVPGRIFIVGEGPQTPTVLIRRVEAITKTATEVVVTTKAARLDEALPAGVIRLDGGAPLSAESPAASGQNPLLAFDLRSKDLERDDDDKDGCKLVGRDQGMEVKYELSSLRLQPHIDLGWDSSGMYITAGLAVSVEQSFSATVRRAVDCTWKLDETKARNTFDRFCRQKLARILHIGPIKLTCSATPVGTLSVSTEAELAAFELSSTARKDLAGTFPPGVPRKGTGNLGKAAVDPRVSIPPIDSTPAGKVEISGDGGLKFGLKGGDLLGIATVQLAIRVAVGGKLSVDTDGHVRASIPAEVALTADLALDPIIKKKWEKTTDLISWHEDLWEWSTGKTGGTIGKTPNPAPSPPPVAVLVPTSLSLVDSGTGAVRQLARAPGRSSILPAYPLRWAPDGNRLAGLTPTGRLTSWNTDGSPAPAVQSCDGCTYDLAFTDDTTIAALEGTHPRYWEGPNTAARVSFYDLTSGRRTATVATPQLTALLGATPTGLLATAGVPRPPDTPDHQASPVDLVWLDRSGRLTRRLPLGEGCTIGETAMSQDGRQLAVLRECGGPVVRLTVVDTETGELDRPQQPSAGRYMLGSIRWTRDGVLLVQSYNLDAAPPPNLLAYSQGRWHTVDRDPVRAAMVTSPGRQVVVMDDRELPYRGELYLLNGKQHGRTGDVYANPSSADRPLVREVAAVWFPPGPEEPVAVR